MLYEVITVITRFKGLGEMNPLQLRETTLDPDTRRLVQLTIEEDDDTDRLMDMLLAKRRSSERRAWLEEKGDLDGPDRGDGGHQHLRQRLGARREAVAAALGELVITSYSIHYTKLYEVSLSGPIKF